MRIRPFAVALLIAFCTGASAQAPTSYGFEAIASSPTQIDVFWNRSMASFPFDLIRNGKRIAVIKPGETKYSDTDLQPNTVYTYSISPIGQPGKQIMASPRPYVERTFPRIKSKMECDVLVVGATSAGVAAAISAARHGLKTVLIEETNRLGGMPVNGLGETDIRNNDNSSGFFEEFRQRVRSIYGSGYGIKYEPRIAHQAMKELLWNEENLVIYRKTRPTKVATKIGKITRVKAENVESRKTCTFLPEIVIDATECGDVAAWAGAPYRLGREARSDREPHAGHIYYDRAKDKPLHGSTGKADNKVQAYAYLMTVQDFGKDADKTIPKPPGYDPKNYEKAPKWAQSWAASSGKLPNNKFEVNQHPQGGDLQGINYDYATATYKERHRIEELYKNHALGYLYYIQTVEGRKNLGLSEDDYRDNNNWPPLLYIREARRFDSGKYIDETDITNSRRLIRPDSIGIGDYPMDSHAVEPKTDWSTPDMGEGEFYLPQYTPWHQVPYHAMIPVGLKNVFVPTAVSATHVAYGTLRLEPVRMHYGDAAGIAAAISIREDLEPSKVPVRLIQQELVRRVNPDELARSGRMAIKPASELIGYRAWLSLFSDVPVTHRKYSSIMWLAARGYYPTPTPAKRTSTSGLTTRPFKPDSPATVGEAIRLLEMLSKRALPGDGKPEISPKFYDLPPNKTLTRANAAELIAGYMGWRSAAESKYPDLTGRSVQSAMALYDHFIGPANWDDKPMFDGQNNLLFQPEKPITNAQLAELVYLCGLYFGPSWNDHPVDDPYVH